MMKFEMFVVIADIKLKEGAEDEFKAWFSKANETISQFSGFVSRRLLKAPDGHHRIIVEFEHKEDFVKLHESQEHAKLHDTAITYMESPPMPKVYDVLVS